MAPQIEATGTMTVWAEGSSRYTDETRFRTIAAREFVRRFRHAVTRQETSFVWLLGAGCSISSGIPGADDAVRSWLKDLKYLETGQEADLEAWACKRFVGYDPDQPGKVYGEVLEALFYTEQDRRREIERMMKVAEPGFGYATLAQLMTHEKWGARCNVSISTNFDDLCADALHLYSQRRPQVFTHESLSRRTPLSPHSPTVVKIFGDAHLPRTSGAGNRPQLTDDVRERLREQMVETGLIIVGYGGRDESVLDMLEGMPTGSPSGGVFWVNSAPPSGAMGDWLESRSAIWVEQGDFDELMYFVRLEFGLGHPKIERFERILRKYEAQYRELSTRSGLGLPETPAAEGEAAPSGSLTLNAPSTLAPRRETEESRRERLRQSLNAFSKVVAGPAKRQPPEESAAALANADDKTKHGASQNGEATADNQSKAGPTPLGAVRAPSENAKMASSMDEPSKSVDVSSSAIASPKKSSGDVEALFAAAAKELQRTRGERMPRASGVAAESEAGETVQDVLTRLGDEAELSIPDGASSDQDVGRDVEVVKSAADDKAGRGLSNDGAMSSSDRDHDSASSKDDPSHADEDGDARPAEVATPPIAVIKQTVENDDAAEKTAKASDDEPVIKTETSAQPVVTKDRSDRRPRDRATRAADAAASMLNDLAAMRAAPHVADATLPPRPLAKLSDEAASAGDVVFAAAIDKRPDDGGLQLRYAHFLSVGMRDAERAERAFEAAINLAPENVAALRDYAQFAIEQLQDAGRAERLLTKALNLDLRNAETLRSLAGFLLRARGDLDEAENCYRLAIEVSPEEPKNLVAYARFLDERRGRREAAEANLRRAAECEKRDAASLAELAIFRASQAHNFDSAEKILQQALRLDAKSATVALAQAILAERKGDLDSAEIAFEHAIQRDPSEMRAQLGYARFLRTRRCELEAADEQYCRAVAAAPDAAEPHSAYAMFLEEVRNDAAAAEQSHRRALELEPYNPLVLSAFAEHLGKREEMIDEADILFRDALRLSPRSAPILRAYGRFLDRYKGDADAAETYLRRAVEMDPHGVEALDDLAQFLHAVREDAEEAEVYFREALRLAPDRAETLNRFAAFLRDSRRNLDEAERCYRRALERNPKDAATLSRAAQFLLSEGRRSEGLKLLNDAFDAAWSMDPSVRASWLMLELWIYRYAHDPARREESLKAARGLIEQGARSEGWDLGPTVEQAIAAGHPKPDLLRDLAQVATDGADPKMLAKHFA